MWGDGTGSTGSGQGIVAGLCEHTNEFFGSIKAEHFLTIWVNYQVFK